MKPSSKGLQLEPSRAGSFLPLIRPKKAPSQPRVPSSNLHSLLPHCAALGPGTNHSPTESPGYLGFGLNGSSMVQKDLCNSHVSIARCTVERGQLILGREKGSRAQYGVEGPGFPQVED